MNKHNWIQNIWLDFLDKQEYSKYQHCLELLPILRMRYGNLLRETLISISIEYKHGYQVTIEEIAEPRRNISIDRYINNNQSTSLLIKEINQLEFDDIKSLKKAACALIKILDYYSVACELDIFTSHTLAFIERAGIEQTDSFVERLEEYEQTLEKKNSEIDFYSVLAKTLAKESAFEIHKKVESIVGAQYKSNPDFNLESEKCNTEWDELGAMLFNNSNELLDVGIEQLKIVISQSIKQLSRSERLALWCEYGTSHKDFVEDTEPDEDFDLLDDRDSFNEIIESLFQSITSSMVNEWEDKRFADHFKTSESSRDEA